MNRADLFPNRKPTEEQGAVLDDLTDQFVAIATVLDHVLPEGRCKSTAFTKLEEASMWAKKSVLFDQQ